nr:hypothetical protein [Tanacetum cinerariifolium]
MAFRNFMYAKYDEDLFFLPCEPSPRFGTSSTSASINNEPLLLEADPLDSANTKQLVKNTADSGGSPAHEEMLVIGTSSVVGRMKDRKCRTKGFTKPPFLTIFDDEEGLPDALELQTTTDCHLMVSNIIPLAWRGHLDNQLDAKLLNIYDHCYIKRECDVLKERDKARDKECKKLKAKCEVAMAYFDNNHAVNVLHQKIKSLSDEVEKGRLEAAEAMLCQEVKAINCDRVEVVSKVVSYATMELVHSDEMVMLVGKLVSFAIFYGRCTAFEEVADMKKPFDLAKENLTNLESKVAALEVEKGKLEVTEATLYQEIEVVKCDRAEVVSKVVPYVAMKLVYSNEMAMLVGKLVSTAAGNDLGTAAFQFLSEVIVDPSASVEVLFSKKPKSLHHPTPTKTHQSVVDNAINQRACEFLRVVDFMKGECDVLKERDKARDKECEELKAKCEVAMADFENNPAINVLCQKIKSFLDDVKEHKASMDKMLLESQK